jgi:hypothetical protein
MNDRGVECLADLWLQAPANPLEELKQGLLFLANLPQTQDQRLALTQAHGHDHIQERSVDFQNRRA